MTYKQADELWQALNDVMLTDERFKGYRPVIQHIDVPKEWGGGVNNYRVEIRKAYERT